jgi:hypothetical protein
MIFHNLGLWTQYTYAFKDESMKRWIMPVWRKMCVGQSRSPKNYGNFMILHDVYLMSSDLLSAYISTVYRLLSEIFPIQRNGPLITYRYVILEPNILVPLITPVLHVSVVQAHPKAAWRIFEKRIRCKIINKAPIQWRYIQNMTNILVSNLTRIYPVWVYSKKTGFWLQNDLPTNFFW